MDSILQKQDPILRDKAKIVAIMDIRSEKIKEIIEQMKIAMHTQKDGVAIAA